MDIKYIIKSDVRDNHYLSESNGIYRFKICYDVADIKTFDSKEEAVAACEQSGCNDFINIRPIILEVVI